MIIKEKINDFSYIFYNCRKLKWINEYIDVKNGRNFSWMFYNYFSLTDVSVLKDWNFREEVLFHYLFNNCSSLSDICALKE